MLKFGWTSNILNCFKTWRTLGWGKKGWKKGRRQPVLSKKNWTVSDLRNTSWIKKTNPKPVLSNFGVQHSARKPHWFQGRKPWSQGPNEICISNRIWVQISVYIFTNIQRICISRSQCTSEWCQGFSASGRMLHVCLICTHLQRWHHWCLICCKPSGHGQWTWSSSQTCFMNVPLQCWLVCT